MTEDAASPEIRDHLQRMCSPQLKENKRVRIRAVDFEGRWSLMFAETCFA
jgi:hypothetical protein